MRTAANKTKTAEGVNVPHKRGHVAVTIIIPIDEFQKLKAKAITNCRSLSAECRYHVLQALKPGAQQ